MSHYVTRTLEEDEQIVLRGRLHWSLVSHHLFFMLLLSRTAAGLVVAGYYSVQRDMYVVAAVYLVLVAVVYVIRGAGLILNLP